MQTVHSAASDLGQQTVLSQIRRRRMHCFMHSNVDLCLPLFSLYIIGEYGGTYYIDLLTHLCRVDSSSLTIRTGPFPIKGGLARYYYYHAL